MIKQNFISKGNKDLDGWEKNQKIKLLLEMWNQSKIQEFVP